MAFEPIRKLVVRTVAGHGLSKQLTVRRVTELFPSVLSHLWGEERSRHVTPVSFREGTLKIESTSAVALQQLQVDQVRLLNEMNRQLGERAIVRLELRSKGF